MESVLMRVHKKFKEEVEETVNKNKNIKNNVEATELITRHNAFWLIKDDLEEYGKDE